MLVALPSRIKGPKPSGRKTRPEIECVGRVAVLAAVQRSDGESQETLIVPYRGTTVEHKDINSYEKGYVVRIVRRVAVKREETHMVRRVSELYYGIKKI